MSTPNARRHRRRDQWTRLVAGAGLSIAFALAVLVWQSPAASAHVIPTSTIQLAVAENTIDAVTSIPLSDLETASHIDLGDGTRADVDTHAAAIQQYLLNHFSPTGDQGQTLVSRRRDSQRHRNGRPD